jgi:hypothetical protein
MGGLRPLEEPLEAVVLDVGVRWTSQGARVLATATSLDGRNGGLIRSAARKSETCQTPIAGEAYR